MIGLLLPATVFGLVLQRPPPLGAARAALPLKAAPHMVASSDEHVYRGTPIGDQVTAIDATKSFLASSALRAVVGPLVSSTIALALFSRGKVEKDKDAGPIVGTIETVIRKLVKPTGSNNWKEMGYATYPPYDYSKIYPSMNKPSTPVDVSGAMMMFDGKLDDLTIGYVFTAGKIVRLIRLAIASILEILTGSLRGKDMFEEAYGEFLEEPSTVTRTLSSGTTDAAFAEQFLAGTNPLMIERVTDVGKVPEGGQTLVEELKSQGKDLQTLADANKLFVVSYDVLTPFERTRKQLFGATSSTFMLPLPVVLLEIRDMPTGPALMPLGIQLDTETTDSLDFEANCPVILPDSPNWASAKACVLTSDSSVHEWISHLARTHLTMEPHIIAVNNKLKQHNHRVFQFLEPHLMDTLFLNVAARETLLTYKGDCVADSNFAIGAGQVLEIAQTYWQNYDFFKYSFEGDLASRGFGPDEAPLPGYYYQHDGQMMWDSLGRYCEDFVDQFYPTDDAVKTDSDVQAWAAETQNPAQGNVPGFPNEIHSKKLLTKTLQSIIGIGTIHHNGVNFPQFDYMSFQPNRPSVTLTSFAGYESYEQRHKTIKQNARSIALITSVLTLPSDHSLLDLEPGAFFKNDELAKDKFASIYKNLKHDLGGLTKTIDARNKDLLRNKGIPYEYLRPDKVACGIDI